MILTKPLSEKCHIRTCCYNKIYHFPNDSTTNSTFDTVHKSAGLNVMTQLLVNTKMCRPKNKMNRNHEDKVVSLLEGRTKEEENGKH